MKTAIVVLGSSNDTQGNLSTIALERCREALSAFRAHRGAWIIPTGGWGAHFNTTAKPHWRYVRAYLEAQGIPGASFLAGVESVNTIEDARLCRPVVEGHGIEELVVVTSDFHVPRARFLFEREFPGVRLTFLGAQTHLGKDELARLRQHEEQALAQLRVRFPN